MIKVEELSKNFGEVKAVNEVSFEVKEGEILGLLGPNGAGKTTTLRLISGYFYPDHGEVNIAGYNAQEEMGRVRELIGYLPEYNPIYQDFLVYDYLCYIAEMREIPASQKEQRVKDMVQVCRLNEVVHKKIGELSKGNRQRVGLAQAMINDPQILILDEPTAGLDPNQISEIRDLIKNLGKKKTLILSSHILSEVEATCDRVIIVNKGKIVADGNPKKLQSMAVNESRVYLKVVNSKGKDVLEVLKKLDGLKEVELDKSEKSKEENQDIKSYLIKTSLDKDLRPEIFKLANKEGWVLYEMYREVISLEHIFHHLTSN